MRKELFGAIGLLALASCSSDELIQMNRSGDGIQFNVVTHNATRAADVYCNNNKFTAFNVWAVTDGKTYMNGDLIQEENGIWTNKSGERYWPATAVDFFAYVNAGDAFNWNSGAPTVDNYTVEDVVANQKDLVYAVATGKTKESSPVTLNFRHALSQVVFQAKNVNANLYVEVDEVAVCNVNNQGTFTFPTTATDTNVEDHTGAGTTATAGLGSWAYATTRDSYHAGFNAVQLAGDNVVKSLTSANSTDKEFSSQAMLLLPQTAAKWNVNQGVEANVANAYFLVKCKIFNVANATTGYQPATDIALVGSADASAYVAIPVDIAWEQGKKYIYTFVFGEGNGGYIPNPNPTDPENPEPTVDPVLAPITFDVTIDDFIASELTEVLGWDYHFDVKGLNTTFTYKGGSNNGAYSVASYRTNPSTGESKAVAWKATEYSIDGGKSWSKTKPDFLPILTTNAAGSSTATNYNAYMRAQDGRSLGNPHNEVLQQRATLPGTYNLSHKNGAIGVIENTANCYIINNPGSYTFPLVYGNAIKNGADNPSAYTSTQTGVNVLESLVNHDNVAITDPYIYNNVDANGNTIVPDHAVLVWQDENELVKSSSISLTSDKEWVVFNVPAGSTFKQGNAVIAVRDANNTILWSWHIWVTDYIPFVLKSPEELAEEGLKVLNTRQYPEYFTETQCDRVLTNRDGIQCTMMGVDIGWCDGEIKAFDERQVMVRFTQSESNKTQEITFIQSQAEMVLGWNCTTFQWGRKDPMFPAIVDLSSNVSPDPKSCYTTHSELAFQTIDAPVSLGTAIQNPNQYYVTGDYEKDWCDINQTLSGKSKLMNLWNINQDNNNLTKTIYDPSPVGYQLPLYNNVSGFKDYTGSRLEYGKTINSPYLSEEDYNANNRSWIFFCNKKRTESSNDYDTTGGVIFFPISSCMMYTGRISTTNQHWIGLCSDDSNTGYIFSLSREFINISGNMTTLAMGDPVRPVREQ